MAAAGELSIARNVGDDGLGGAGGVEVSGVVRESLDGCGIANIDIPGVFGGIKGNAEGVVEAGGELFDLGSLSIGAHAAKDENGSGAGVGEEEIAIGRGTDEARHGEDAAAEGHDLLVVGALHGSGVAAGVKGNLEASGRERP